MSKIELNAASRLQAATEVKAASLGDKYMSHFIDEGGEPINPTNKRFVELLYDLVYKNGGEVTLTYSGIHLVAVKGNKPLLAYDIELGEVCLPK